MKANTHIVIKREDILKYLTDNQIKYLDIILNTIADGRKEDGKKPDNSYYICNTDEPYADKVLKVILDGEQEPCEDAVSRQAVLNIITEQERLASDRVRDTPSSLGNGLHTWINPAYTRYSAQLSERSQFKTMIQTMPPVTPQPKTGHWIERRNKATGHIESVCSECGAEEGYPYNDYCGNCGAKMFEPQESEVEKNEET